MRDLEHKFPKMQKGRKRSSVETGALKPSGKRMKLPLVTEQVASFRRAKAEHPKTAEQDETKRVLFVTEDGDFPSFEIEGEPVGQDAWFDVSTVTRIDEALSCLSDTAFDVVFIDLALRQNSALSVLHAIASSYPEIAVVILCDIHNEARALDSLRNGAQEYLVKGQFDRSALIRAVRCAVQRKHWEQHLVELSQYDQLTGLPNRMLFQDRLEQAYRDSTRSKAVLGVMCVDLDRFKNINETLGHGVGDLLLQAVSTRLRACVRGMDTVARLGGDEFGVIASDLGSVAEAGHLARRIVDVLNEPFEYGGDNVHFTASIGITLHPIDDGDSAQLLKNAELALYRVKDNGRNAFRFYDSAMNRSVKNRRIVETQIRRALDNEQFTLHFQPNIDSRSGEVVGSEAFIRWNSPERGLVYPGEFIPIAEESSMIASIGEWVLRKACAQASEWRTNGKAPSRVAVNLSPLQFRRADFGETVIRILDESGLEPEDLELEITENVVMADFKSTENSLKALYDHGVRLVIDDFGTGYASLTYLKRFPVYKLKVDRSFVSEVNSNPDDAEIAKAIIKMAHSLKLLVVGEGVETPDQKEFLSKRDCDELQGYLFSRPLAPKQFESWVADFRNGQSIPYNV
jgi:diguanylate cyclase (GGDEF)-like protein